jgi:phenylpyruvate tautomerase PptA (4-oxalocrotonate tautomerase family)
MPVSKIEVRRSHAPEQVQAMIEAVYLAQRIALKLPEHDRQISYIEHRPEYFAVPQNKGENYTFVEITMFSGRSLDAKRHLYQEIIQRFEALGIQPNDVFILLNEQPMDNWGIRGGVPASEVDLGFDVKV